MNILAQFFRWLASRNEVAATPEGQETARKAREDAEAASVQAKVDKAQKAVVDGKEDDVNKTLRDMPTRDLVGAGIKKAHAADLFGVGIRTAEDVEKESRKE